MTVTPSDDLDVDPDAPIDPWLEIGFTDAELEEWLGAPNPTEVPGLDEPLPVDLDDAWAGVEVVAPRPLRGVTGVAGPALAGVLSALDMSGCRRRSWWRR